MVLLAVDLAVALKVAVRMEGSVARGTAKAFLVESLSEDCEADLLALTDVIVAAVTLVKLTLMSGL